MDPKSTYFKMTDWRGKIRVGTSGFSFPDWAKTFYRGVPRDLWLKYYVSLFNSLELNTTFYAVPPPERIERIVAQLPRNFSLTIKAPRKLTHERSSPSEFLARVAEFERAIAPARRSPVFEGILFQFPVSFIPGRQNLDHLRRLMESIDGKKFFEFRHSGWMDRKVLEFLQNYNAGWVIPDVPDIDDLTKPEPILTSDDGYIRLHGRNRENWYASDRDRYDYLYSNSQIDWIMDLVRTLVDRGAKKVFVFFNNCHAGKAAYNALQMMEKLGLYTPPAALL